MKKYWSFFRIRLVAGLQYRAAALAGVATQFAWGALLTLLYHAFYESDASRFPMTMEQLSSYIWLQQAFLAMFNTWAFDHEIFNSITSGGIAYELARPMNLYHMWFIKNLALRVARTALRCVPVLVIAALLPRPYGLLLPPDPLALCFFLITMVFGALLIVSFLMLVYISAFYTISPVGMRVMAATLAEFLAGSHIPLPFWPDWLRSVVELSPFAGMQNLPFRIYSGNIAGGELITGVLLQIFWLLAFWGLGQAWMYRAQRRVVVQGG